MSRPDGGPAYPVIGMQDTDSVGMSLRDYFAGQAMTGLMENDAIEVPDAVNADQTIADYARFAYRCADAMLAERAKP
jgi:hypothetical protein